LGYWNSLCKETSCAFRTHWIDNCQLKFVILDATTDEEPASVWYVKHTHKLGLTHANKLR